MLGLKQSAAAGGLLHQVFSARTRCLVGDLCGDEVRSYLSGIVIGSELRAVAEQGYLEDEVHLIGGNDAAQNYAEGLRAMGAKVKVWSGESVTVAGLSGLGRLLGLYGDQRNG